MKLKDILRLPLLILVIPFSLGNAAPFLHSGKSTSGKATVSGKGKEQSLILEHDPLYLGTITAGAKGNDEEFEGNFSVVAPLWSSLGSDGTLGGGILFAEPYLFHGEGGSRGGSLGVGYRYLFSGQAVDALTHFKRQEQAGFLEEGYYIGANAFIDLMQTRSENEFWQLGFGVEVGSRYVELSANYYIPLSDRQLAETYRTRDVNRNSSTSRSSRVAYGDPYATGNTIAQDAFITNYSTTTTRTVTIDRLFHRYEEGMQGWDARVAVLIPWVDRYMDVKLIGGYYSFENPLGSSYQGARDIEGWKAGIEIRPVPAIILTGTWYEDEALTGAEWIVGVQLQIPFEAGDLGDGKGFWDRIGDSFKPRRRHLAERMAEPVARQNATINVASGTKLERESIRTKVDRKTRVVGHSQQQLVLADDLIFVNNGQAVGNGIMEGGTALEDGTAERPFDSIQEAADLAGNRHVATNRVWNVYTQGALNNGGSNYIESVNLSASTTFISSTTPIVSSFNGAIFGTGDVPVVEGGFAADAAKFIGGSSSSFAIAGYEITQGYSSASNTSTLVAATTEADGDGVYARNVEEVAVFSNTIQGVGNDGITIINPSDSTAIVSQNEIFANEFGNGLVLEFTDPATPGYALVQGNQFEDNGYNGIWILVDNGSQARIDIFANDLNENGRNGIRSRVQNGSVLNGVIGVNSITGNERNGISTLATTSGEFLVDILFNLISENQISGIRSRASFEGMISNMVGLNLINENGESGIYVNITDAGVYSGAIEENFVHGNMDGIKIDVSNMDSLFEGQIINNYVFENLDDGIEVTAQEGGFFDGNIYNNTIFSSGDDGIVANMFIGTFEGDISFNHIYSSGGNGIHIDASLVSLFTGNVNDNIILFSGDDGIDIDIQGIAAFSGGIFNNFINQSEDHGINININAIGGFLGGIYNNEIANSGNDGIHMNLSNGAFTEGILANNIYNNGSDGIDIDITGGGFSGGISENIINNQGNNGIEISISTGFFAGDISLNTIAEHNNGFAIDVDIDAFVLLDTTFTSTIRENFINQADGGIRVEMTAGNVGSNVLLNGGISDNTISNVNTGIYVELQGGLGALAIFNGGINNNIIQNVAAYGIELYSSGDLGGTARFNGGINNNTINYANTGIHVEVQGGSAIGSGNFYGGITNNTIQNVDASGIELYIEGGLGGAAASFNGGILNNTLVNVGEMGIDIVLDAGSLGSPVVFNGGVLENILTDVRDYGIHLDVRARSGLNPATFNGGINNNVLTRISNNGIDVHVLSGALGGNATFNGGIGNNAIDTFDAYAIHAVVQTAVSTLITFSGSASLNGGITNNTLWQSNGDPTVIRARLINGAGAGPSPTGSSILNNTLDGLPAVLDTNFP